MLTPTAEIISLLESNGWTVECKSPFEIRHDETGSFATQLAAVAVVNELRSELAEEFEDEHLSQAQAFEQLQAVAQRVARIVEVAAATGPETDDNAEASEAWETAYNLVIGPELSRRAHTLSNRLNKPLSYYDPDASHEDDTRAFHRALTEHVAKLAPFFV